MAKHTSWKNEFILAHNSTRRFYNGREVGGGVQEAWQQAARAGSQAVTSLTTNMKAYKANWKWSRVVNSQSLPVPGDLSPSARLPPKGSTTLPKHDRLLETECSDIELWGTFLILSLTGAPS